MSYKFKVPLDDETCHEKTHKDKEWRKTETKIAIEDMKLYTEREIKVIKTLYIMAIVFWIIFVFFLGATQLGGIVWILILLPIFLFAIAIGNLHKLSRGSILKIVEFNLGTTI